MSIHNIIFSKISFWISRSRLLARFIFGIDFCSIGPEDYYFDVTTIVLYKYVSKKIDKTVKVLDLGTGAMATIGISLWKKTGCNVLSIDINDKLVELAMKNVKLNNAPIDVVQAKFIDFIDDKFSVVVFNPPYVSIDTGKRRKLSDLRRTQWDGGKEGIDIITELFEEIQMQGRALILYIGMNHLHVKRDKMINCVNSFADIKINKIYRSPLLPVDVYCIKSF